MKRRDFLKLGIKTSALVMLFGTGIEAKAMVQPYDWPGEPTKEPVEGTECGKSPAIEALPDIKTLNDMIEDRLGELRKAQEDMFIYGTGVMKDGKHIPLSYLSTGDIVEISGTTNMDGKYKLS